MVFKKVDHGVRVDSFDAFFRTLIEKNRFYFQEKTCTLLPYVCTNILELYICIVRTVCQKMFVHLTNEFFAMYRILMVKKRLYF